MEWEECRIKWKLAFQDRRRARDFNSLDILIAFEAVYGIVCACLRSSFLRTTRNGDPASRAGIVSQFAWLHMHQQNRGRVAYFLLHSIACPQQLRSFNAKILSKVEKRNNPVGRDPTINPFSRAPSLSYRLTFLRAWLRTGYKKVKILWTRDGNLCASGRFLFIAKAAVSTSIKADSLQALFFPYVLESSDSVKNAPQEWLRVDRTTRMTMSRWCSPWELKKAREKRA